MIKVRTVVSALLPILLCLTLLGTIYFTLFDWQWIAFLSGVFIAAVLALSSRTTSAEWRIVRRTRQLEKLKEKLAARTTLHHAAERLLAETNERNKLLFDAIADAMVYVDAKQVCRFHNTAFAAAVALPDAEIDGRMLRDVLGDDTYSSVRSGVERMLAGEQARLEQTLRLSHGGAGHYASRFIAHTRPDGGVSGFCVLLSEAPNRNSSDAESRHAARRAASDAGAEILYAEVPEVTEVLEATGELHYLMSMSEDLTGWEDPRARFMEALERDQFCLLYQAIVPVALEGFGPHYCEILIRLQEEEQKMMPPGAFFPVAERYHLMPALDRWVIRHLLRWYRAERHAANIPRFCINISGDSIADPALPEFILREIQTNGVPAAVLCFELAEPDVIANRAAAIRFSKAVTTIGSEVTIDGFGSTCTSFGYLQDMAVNFLKIDGGIIGTLIKDPVSLAKARAIIKAAHLTNRRSIAEFVESDETLEKLRELGVDYVQGFGIARPKPLSELAPARPLADAAPGPN
jgi:PAS domain S-box-containing protein